MRTPIGEIAAALLQERGRSSIGYADPDLLDHIAALAEVRITPYQREHVMRAIGRDERFIQDYMHIPRGDSDRRVRVFYVAPPSAAPARIELPADPWLRRVFVGTILDLDPLAVTPSHTAAVAAALPEALQRLTRKQYHRICATYGMAGIERQPQGEQANDTQRTRVTIRNSVRRGMSNLAASIRERILPVAASEPTETLLGDPLFWERVDRTGPCWLWQGVLDHGSPTFKRGGKKRQARRYVYELYSGPIPTEHLVIATCESDRCVHPEHIVVQKSSFH